MSDSLSKRSNYGRAMADVSYDVLLLDFGGVCLVNPVELHAWAEDSLGLAPGTFDWMGPVDPSTDEKWRRMIDGELTERQYWAERAAEVGRVSGVEMDTRTYMSMLYDPPRPELIRPEATAVVERAKAAGLGVSILTNDMRAFHGEAWERQVEFLDSADHVVDCSITNVLKPDARAYQQAVDAVGAAPERILFVDDQPRNVEGGRAAGLDAVWFDIADAPAAWTDVAHRLGL